MRPRQVHLLRISRSRSQHVLADRMFELSLSDGRRHRLHGACIVGPRTDLHDGLRKAACGRGLEVGDVRLAADAHAPTLDRTAHLVAAVVNVAFVTLVDDTRDIAGPFGNHRKRPLGERPRGVEFSRIALGVAQVMAVLDRQVVVIRRSLIGGSLFDTEVRHPFVDVDQRPVRQCEFNVAQRHQPVLIRRQLRQVINHDRFDGCSRHGALYGRRRKPGNLQSVGIGVAFDMLSVHVERNDLVQVAGIVRRIVEFDPQASGLVLDEHRVVHLLAASGRIGHRIVARRAVADHAARDIDVARDLTLAHRQQVGDRDLFGLLEGARPVGLHDGEHTRHRSAVSPDTHLRFTRLGARIRRTGESLAHRREVADRNPRGIGRIDQFGHPVDIRLDAHGEGLALDRNGLARLLDVDLQFGLVARLVEPDRRHRKAVDHDIQCPVALVGRRILLDHGRETGVADTLRRPVGQPFEVLFVGGYEFPASVVGVHQKILCPARRIERHLLNPVFVVIEDIDIFLLRLVLFARRGQRRRNQGGRPGGKDAKTFYHRFHSPVFFGYLIPLSTAALLHQTGVFMSSAPP